MPNKFLTIRVDRLEPPPPLTAACAGYEERRWRCRELARHTLQWLPEFALRYSELRRLDHTNAVARVAECARAVYASKKYQSRGEFGEILLHILLRQHIGTVPAVSKIFFKDARNDTVKGFDAVHVLDDAGALELWLGEVKFYANLSKAIAAAVGELEAHTKTDYLRDEFVAIGNKLDEEWEHADAISSLLARERSMDEVISAICIPVLLTYDSDVLGSFESVSEEFEEAFRQEVISGWQAFCDRLPDLPTRIHLFLLPLKDKAALVREMHEVLEHAQELI